MRYEKDKVDNLMTSVDKSTTGIDTNMEYIF